jgi:hypothetical protein
MRWVRLVAALAGLAITGAITAVANRWKVQAERHEDDGGLDWLAWYLGILIGSGALAVFGWFCCLLAKRVYRVVVAKCSAWLTKQTLTARETPAAPSTAVVSNPIPAGEYRKVHNQPEDVGSKEVNVESLNISRREDGPIEYTRHAEVVNGRAVYLEPGQVFSLVRQRTDPITGAISGRVRAKADGVDVGGFTLTADPAIPDRVVLRFHHDVAPRPVSPKLPEGCLSFVFTAA